MQRSVEEPGGAATQTDAARELPPFAGEGGGTADRASLQGLMWDKVGIVRDGAGLAAAARQLSAWRAALPVPSDRPSHELANMILAARLVAEAALIREESRGAHYRTDFPSPREEWRRHITFRRGAAPV